MIYEVKITPTAEEEIRSAFAYIHARAPLNAERWLRGIYKAINALEHLPTRCGYAREAEYLGEPLRQYVFKSHRIVFRVEERRKIVRILWVRHAAMRAIGEPYSDDD